jgi:pyruvate dehydrogenase (quinone)
MYGIVDEGLNRQTDAGRGCGEIEWLRVQHDKCAAGAEAHQTAEKLAVCAAADRHSAPDQWSPECQSSCCPCSGLPRASPRPRSAVAISGKPSTGSISRMLLAGSRLPEQCRASSRLQSARRSLGQRGVSAVALQIGRSRRAAATPACVTASYVDLDRLAVLLNGNNSITILCGFGCEGAQRAQRWCMRCGQRACRVAQPLRRAHNRLIGFE